MQKKILVTGGAGYIGSHTAYLLAHYNYKVLVLDNFLHNQFFSPSWASVIKADYADEKVLESLFSSHSIHAVMHFAAAIEPHISVQDPLYFYQNNVSKTVKLLQKLTKYQVPHFILSSSCAVYGNPAYLPLDEQHPLNPLNPYGKTKLMIEQILEDTAKAHKLSYISLRYFNAGGALPEQHLGEQHSPETHLIARVLNALIEQSPIEIYGNQYPTQDGTAIRDFVHVLDIAHAHVLALEYLQTHNTSQIFNLGSTKGISVLQMIKAVEKISNTTLNIAYKPARAGDAHTLVADTKKARDILQWHPKHSDIENILQSALTFEQLKRQLRLAKEFSTCL